MRISEYTSVPSKDIDNERNESTVVSEPGETSVPLWVQGTDSPPEPEDDTYGAMEEEEHEIMLKERGEDDTVVDMGENWNGADYSKNNKNDRSILPCLLITAVFIIAWVSWTIIHELYRTENISSSSTLSNRIQFDDIYNGTFYPQWTALKWSSAGGDDGVFIYQDSDNNIILEKVSDNSKKTLVKGREIVD
ncbi:5980_t:CDS:2, partial [Scutellospora calospora]